MATFCKCDKELRSLNNRLKHAIVLRLNDLKIIP